MPHDLKQPGLVPFPKLFAVLGYAVFCGLVIVILAEGAGWVVWTIYSHFHSPLRRAGPDSENLIKRRRGLKHRWSWTSSDTWDTDSASPAYDAYPWAEEYWEEERFRIERERDAALPYEPFRLWSWPRFNGKFTNTDETEMGKVRRTVNHFQSGCDHSIARKVWFFGGSTAWGQSTPDFATIPSYLSGRLNAPAHDCFEIFNMGVPAYVTNQEVIYLTQLLKGGHRPDIVIFYDGINDTTVGAFSPALPATHFDYAETKAKAESKILSWPDLSERFYLLRIVRKLRNRAQSRAQRELSGPEWQARAKATLDNYESNLQLAQTIAKEHGFEVRFFWQPILLYGNKPRTPFERVISENQGMEKAIRVVYQEAEHRLVSTGKVVSLAHIFDTTTEAIYTDCVHLGPRGNEIVAAAIAAQLQSALTNPEKTSPAGSMEEGQSVH